MKIIEHVVILLVVVMCGFAVASASNYGAKDRSFDVKDEVTGNMHSVTQRSIDACKSMSHYSIVTLDGVERRCIQNKEVGATTLHKGG